MRINLIYNLYELNGAYTSFEDLYHNLKKYTNYDIRFIVLYKDKNVFNRFKEYLVFGSGIAYIQIAKYNRDGTKQKDIFYDFKSDISIISSEIIHLIKDGNINVTSNQTILFYPAFVYKQEAIDTSRYQYELEYIKQNNVLVVGNEYNKKYVDNCFVWYMKFSVERINRIKKMSTNENEILIAEDYYKNKMSKLNIKPFSYKLYKYYRYDKKNENNLFTDFGARYYENIGKLMFEFILLDKQSIYLPKNKHGNDGLTEFMCYLGYDDNIEHYFSSDDKKYLEEKLYMNSTDELLQLF